VETQLSGYELPKYLNRTADDTLTGKIQYHAARVKSFRDRGETLAAISGSVRRRRQGRAAEGNADALSSSSSAGNGDARSGEFARKKVQPPRGSVPK